MRVDPLVLLQYAGVDLKPNLDIVSEGKKRTAGQHFVVFKYVVHFNLLGGYHISSRVSHIETTGCTMDEIWVKLHAPKTLHQICRSGCLNIASNKLNYYQIFQDVDLNVSI